MILRATAKVGVKSLLANKMRSVLATLGIIIGSGAVIAMLAIGSGAQKQVLDRFASMGSNVIIVTPGLRGAGGVLAGTQQNLKLDDALAIAGGIEGASLVAPGVSGGVQIKYYARNARTSLYGTSVSYFVLRDIAMEKGRVFSEEELNQDARVAVIGPTAAKNVFGPSEPVGEVVKVNGIGFRIVGITKAKGEGWGSPDDRIFVPYTTAMKQVLGVDNLREISVQTANEDELTRVQSDIGDLLRKRHRIRPEADDDFTVTNLAEIRKSASEVTDIFRWLLGGIAAISLLVGGIGIMNVMLVTVAERTREIGIRKAVGARDRHILLQFLVESVIVSATGGILGLLLGVGVALVVPSFSPFKTVVEVGSALLALGVAAGVGIFFGLYPAWKASRLDPIEALRHE